MRIDETVSPVRCKVMTGRPQASEPGEDPAEAGSGDGGAADLADAAAAEGARRPKGVNMVSAAAELAAPRGMNGSGMAVAIIKWFFQSGD